MFENISERLNTFCILPTETLKSVQIQSFFWSVFSRIWTEYGDLILKSSYSAQMRENMDQKNFIRL